MARAYGWDSVLSFCFESTYGTAPSDGYIRLPFISCDIGAEQGLLPDDVLGLGRDPQAPIVDLVRVSGSIVVPLDNNNIGYWIKLALGAPASTGAGPYVHTFTSGVTTQVSATIDIYQSQVPHASKIVGLVVNSFSIGLSRTGKPVMTLQCTGKNETVGTSVVDATPVTALTLTRFTQAQGSLTWDGSALSNIISASMDFDNGIELVEAIPATADALITAADWGMCKLNGSITQRFGDSTLLDDAIAQTVRDLKLAWTIDSTHLVSFEGQSVYAQRSKRTVNGPGGVEVQYPWIGAKDASEGEMLEVILKTGTATYT